MQLTSCDALIGFVDFSFLFLFDFRKCSNMRAANRWNMIFDGDEGLFLDHFYIQCSIFVFIVCQVIILGLTILAFRNIIIVFNAVDALPCLGLALPGQCWIYIYVHHTKRNCVHFWMPAFLFGSRISTVWFAFLFGLTVPRYRRWVEENKKQKQNSERSTLLRRESKDKQSTDNEHSTGHELYFLVH